MKVFGGHISLPHSHASCEQLYRHHSHENVDLLKRSWCADTGPRTAILAKSASDRILGVAQRCNIRHRSVVMHDQGPGRYSSHQSRMSFAASATHITLFRRKATFLQECFSFRVKGRRLARSVSLLRTNKNFTLTHLLTPETSITIRRPSCPSKTSLSFVLPRVRFNRQIRRFGVVNFAGKAKRD